MKKQGIRLAALGFAALMIVSASGCASRLSETDIKEAYEQALQNSLAADLYFWKETVYDGPNSTYREANVYAEQGKDYEPIRKEDGSYARPKIHVLEKKNGKNTFEAFCGLSAGESGGAEQPMLFERTMGEKEWNSFVQTPMTVQDYYDSEAFQSKYSLHALLGELQKMTPDDMDFSGKKAVAQKKINTSTLEFTVKDAYLESYEALHGKPSPFAGTSKVSIEMAYDKITHIVTYKMEDLGGGLTNEAEKYRLEIVYLGPKFDMPKYK